MGSTAGLDFTEMRKLSFPYRESKPDPSFVQPIT
jgi:hypothetical protein